MRSALALDLRRAAGEPLPTRAFLRRDRGDALFVTNAPMLFPRGDWIAALEARGFACAPAEGLLRLSPGACWLERLEQARPDPPDALCASLLRFKALPPDADSLRLFALGARALDGGEGGARFDRLLRRRAAECLRLNRTDPIDVPRGGGLYACALLAHEIKEVCGI